MIKETKFYHQSSINADFDMQKVKLTLSFRGREIVHKNIGINKVDKFIEDISEYGKPEADKSFSGKMIHKTGYIHQKCNNFN